MRTTSPWKMLATTIVVFMVTTTLAVAAMPQTINYQGYLKDSGGAPVTGSVNITFALYDAATGGTALWSETQGTVPVDNGVYSVELGSVTPISLPFDTPYYLGVTVGADSELSPRQPLTSAPYAFRAEQADSVNSATTIISTVPTGTAPISVLSKTLVPNLNAQYLGGLQYSSFAATNHTHDANSIVSGTLSSGRLSGSYTGITGVGTLSSLTVIGNTSISGALSFSSPKTAYYNVSAPAFTPTNSSITYASTWSGGNNRYLSGGTTGSSSLNASISLPHGAKSQSISCQVDDSSATYDVMIGLANSATNTWECSPVTSSGSAGRQTLTASCYSWTIDDINDSYMAKFISDVACGNKCSVYSCTVVYTITELP